MRSAFATLACSLLFAAPLVAEAPAPAPSECKVLEATGDRFCKYGNRWHLENARAPAFAVGDAFPVYEHNMLMDLRRYNLPAVDGPWRYYLRDGTIYKVDANTATVREVVGRAKRR